MAIPINWPALAKNTAARIVAAGAIALFSLWLARCDGARHQSAQDKQHAADAQAKVSEDAAKVSKHVGDSVKGVFADSMKSLRVAKAKADSDAQHALAHLGTITVIHSSRPAAPRGETILGGDAQPEPDTTKYATIQRQGDPRLYDVPQFVVDLGAELRKSLVEKSDEAAKAERNLAIAATSMAADSNTIHDLRTALASRVTAEDIAKSNAGQECRVLPFIPCPSRKVVALTFTLAGLVGGYELVRR
jgi:hypothetical protein